MKRIYDKQFRYVPAAKTDIAKTFKRILAEQKRAAEETASKVATLPGRKAA